MKRFKMVASYLTTEQSEVMAYSDLMPDTSTVFLLSLGIDSDYITNPTSGISGELYGSLGDEVTKGMSYNAPDNCF